MGDKAKELKKLLAEGEHDGPLVQLLGYAEDIYGTMSGAYAAYGAAKGILIEFGILDKPVDPLSVIVDLLEDINRKIEEVLLSIDDLKNKVLAGTELTQMYLLTEPKSRALTAFDHALDFIKDPAAEPNRTVFIGLIEDSWIAMNQLSMPDFALWQRLFHERAVYSDVWSGPGPPEGISGEKVWDYRTTLPAYLQILEWQTFVYLAAIELGDSYRSHSDDMARYGDFLLNDVFKKILASFVFIMQPSYEDMKYVITTIDDANFYWYRKEGENETFVEYDFIDPVDGRPVRKLFFDAYAIDWLLENRIPGGRWRLAGYNFGAVERYSGYDSTFGYPLGELKTAASLIETEPRTYYADYNSFAELWWVHWKVTVKDPVGFQNFYNRFLLRHSLRTLRQSKQLYGQLGLSKLCASIRHYYSLLNLPIPKELDNYHARFTSWSVREVRALFPPGIGGVNVITPPADADFSLRWMAKTMEPFWATFSNTISLRKLFLIDEELVPLE